MFKIFVIVGILSSGDLHQMISNEVYETKEACEISRPDRMKALAEYLVSQNVGEFKLASECQDMTPSKDI